MKKETQYKFQCQRSSCRATEFVPEEEARPIPAGSIKTRKCKFCKKGRMKLVSVSR